jgi:hypothetical protein
MTYSITAIALSQAFTAATDSISTSLTTTGACGTFTYSNTDAYSWMTVDPVALTVSVQTTNLALANTYTATLKASLVSYPTVFTSVTFSVTLVDPCVSTTMSLPALTTFTITAFSGTGFS